MIDSVPDGVLKISRGTLHDTLPDWFERANGYFLYSPEGKDLVDLVMGRGSLTLGHCWKDIDESVIHQIRNGHQFGLSPQIYFQLAQALNSFSPFPKTKSLFLKNGSDAVRLSLRVARAKTGRSKVAFCGYHSWQDEFLPEFWPNKGSAPNQQDYFNFFYDLASLEEYAEHHFNDIAAVLVTPEPGLIPSSFYRKVREICRATNSLLIMDEIKCGYHISLFGVSEKEKISPDLILLSKGLANGHALSVVVGPGEIMDAADASIVFGTYFQDAIPLAAALTVLKTYEESNVIESLETSGRRIKELFNHYFEAHHVPFAAGGPSSLPIVAVENPEIERAFVKSLFQNGIYMYTNDNMGLSLAHRDVFPCLEERLVRALAHLKEEVVSLPKNNIKKSLHRIFDRKLIRKKDHLIEEAIHLFEL